MNGENGQGNLEAVQPIAAESDSVVSAGSPEISQGFNDFTSIRDSMTSFSSTGGLPNLELFDSKAGGQTPTLGGSEAGTDSGARSAIGVTPDSPQPVQDGSGTGTDKPLSETESGTPAGDGRQDRVTGDGHDEQLTGDGRQDQMTRDPLGRPPSAAHDEASKANSPKVNEMFPGEENQELRDAAYREMMRHECVEGYPMDGPGADADRKLMQERGVTQQVQDAIKERAQTRKENHCVPTS